MKHIGPLIVVEDIASSRQFYEHILGQRVQHDFAENISFEGNFAIRRKAHYQTLLGNVEQYPTSQKTHNFELYFETENLTKIDQQFKESGVKYIHEIREQPWGSSSSGYMIQMGASSRLQKRWRQWFSVFITWECHLIRSANLLPCQ